MRDYPQMVFQQGRPSMGDSGYVRVRFDEFELDEGNARLTRNGVPVPLPPKAFAVLCALVRQPGRLLSKNDLLDKAWGHTFVSDSVLKTTVGKVRAALSDDARQPRYIETASRRGYRFIPGVQASFPPSVVAALPPAAISNADLATMQDRAVRVIGRQEAFDKLHAAWSMALRGRRQLVCIAGEAGIGKTTLIDRFAEELPGVVCVHGQCVEQFGAGEPYLPVLEALSTLCRQDLTLPAMMRSIAPMWLLQMPWWSSESERAAMQRELAGASQDRMLREMGELLDQYTRDRPLLLIIEDLHWSDHATVRLIDHLARRRGPSRLMWLASFRPASLIAEDHPLNNVRQELRGHGLCEEIPLEPFSEHEVAEYLNRRFPDIAVSDAFIQAVHARTDGLPLFVVNVVEGLLSQGTIGPDVADGFHPLVLEGQNAIPESLVGVIENQLQRLPGELRQLLEAASVCGMEFRPETVADALRRDPGWVSERCDRLARHQNWLRLLNVARRADGALDTTYTFRHALYHHVFYRRLGIAARVEMHQRIALSLQRNQANGGAVTAAELGMHFERGHDIPAALQQYAAAAASATAHFAPLEAAKHSAHALSLLPRCDGCNGRLELELTLVAQHGVANTQLYGVACPEAMVALERAKILCDQLPSTAERAWVMSGLGWVYYTRGEFAEARALAKRIYDQAMAAGDRVLFIVACNLMGVTICNDGDMREARYWLELGIDASVKLGDRMPSARFVVDPEVSMRANLCTPLVLMGLVDAARVQSKAALTRATALGQPMAQMLAHWCACMMEVRLGSSEQVLQSAQALADIVATHTVAQGEGPSRWYRGWALAQIGQAARGYELIVEGYERHVRFGMFAGCPLVLGFAADARAQLSDWGGAQRHLDDALALARRIGELAAVPELQLRQARLALACRRNDTACDALRVAATNARQCGAQGLEVDVLSALCEISGVTPKDVEALRVASNDLPLGFDEGLRARALRTLSAFESTSSSLPIERTKARPKADRGNTTFR